MFESHVRRVHGLEVCAQRHGAAEEMRAEAQLLRSLCHSCLVDGGWWTLADVPMVHERTNDKRCQCNTSRFLKLGWGVVGPGYLRKISEPFLILDILGAIMKVHDVFDDGKSVYFVMDRMHHDLLDGLLAEGSTVQGFNLFNPWVVLKSRFCQRNIE